MHGARPLRSVRRLQNLAGPGRWYSIRNQAAGQPAVVSIYDEIGFLGTSAQSFIDELRQIPGSIELHISSPGGDVFDGIAIYNALRQAQARGDVHVIVDGLAASAASFIAQAASPGQLEMAPHSQMMIHDGFAMAIGSAQDMRELADQLDKVSDNIASIYAERTGKTADHFRGLMRQETWLTDQETVDEGLADRIIGQEDSGGVLWDLSVYAHAPGASKPKKAKGGKKKQDDSGWVQDPDGKWRFDPDGDGDDDSTPEGDTDHDYWDEDGNQLKPVPPKPKKAMGHVHTHVHDAAHQSGASSVDEGAWDGDAAMARALKADDPAAAFRAICAGEKTVGSPDQSQHWALPHHDNPGSPPNRKGVASAMGYLDRTQDLKDKAAAQAHLEAHQRAMGSSDSPDDHIDGGQLQALLVSALEGGTGD